MAVNENGDPTENCQQVAEETTGQSVRLDGQADQEKNQKNNQKNDQAKRKEADCEAQNQPDESANSPAAENDPNNSQVCAKPTRKRANQGDPNKKRKKTKKWAKNSVIDKNKLTMFDLISYNPPAIDALSQLNEDEDKPADEKGEPLEDENNAQEEPPLDPANGETKASEEDEESIGPRVKINENGEIVLDEESLIVKRKQPKDQNIKTVYEDDRIISSRTNYSSFKKPGKASEKKLRWTDDETVKFYTALTIIGTDFTLMSDLFFRDTRSRVDLKNKFKQEEKFHKVLIDNALKKSDLTSIQNLEQLNFDVFSSDSEEERTGGTANAEEAAAAT